MLSGGETHLWHSKWLSVHCVVISTHCLVVERHKLAAYVPKRLGVVVGRVHSCSFGVNPAHLPFIVSEKDS